MRTKETRKLTVIENKYVFIYIMTSTPSYILHICQAHITCSSLVQIYIINMMIYQDSERPYMVLHIYLYGSTLADNKAETHVKDG